MSIIMWVMWWWLGLCLQNKEMLTKPQYKKLWKKISILRRNILFGHFGFSCGMCSRFIYRIIVKSSCSKWRQRNGCSTGLGVLYKTSPKNLFLLCSTHQLHQLRRVTADPLWRCVGKSTRTITKLESEPERSRQTLIMVESWLDMLWKVTVDESSIIYSSAELSYLFFQQHE